MEKVENVEEVAANVEAVEPQEETTQPAPREITFGEALIGTEFTAEEVDPIRVVMMLAADLANHMMTVSNPEGGEVSPLKADLIRAATSQILLAQMAAVKVMTFEY
jgi:hypothetical protein